MPDEDVLVERLVDALREGTTSEGHGEFSLDRTRALDRMRELSTQVPSLWIVHCARGLVRAGATDLRVRGKGVFQRVLVVESNFQIRLPADEDSLWPVITGTESDAFPGIREIFIGAFMGINAGIETIEVSCGSDLFEISAKGVTRLSSQADGERTLRITARGRVDEIFCGYRSEIWCLHRRARYGPLELDLALPRSSFAGAVDLDVIPMTSPGPETQRRKRLDSEIEVVAGGWLPICDEGEVRLIVDGVWMETVRLPRLPRFAVVAVRAPLSLDAAMSKCVRDSTYEAVVDAAVAFASKATAITDREVFHLRNSLTDKQREIKKLNRIPLVAGATSAFLLASNYMGATLRDPDPSLVMGSVIVMMLFAPIMLPAMHWGRTRVAQNMARRFPPSHWARGQLLTPEWPPAERSWPLWFAASYFLMLAWMFADISARGWQIADVWQLGELTERMQGPALWGGYAARRRGDAHRGHDSPVARACADAQNASPLRVIGSSAAQTRTVRRPHAHYRRPRASTDVLCIGERRRFRGAVYVSTGRRLCTGDSGSVGGSRNRSRRTGRAHPRHARRPLWCRHESSRARPAE